MRKTIAFLFALISFAACDLTKLEPAQKQAFMKYFGDLGNTRGVDLLKLDDGYLLLGNNTYSGRSTVFLIKTDFQGNTDWVQTHDDFIGSSLAKSTDGYFIIGDGIDGTNPSTMLLVKTNLQGAETARASLGYATSAYHGRGVTLTQNGEVVVSGTLTPINTGAYADSTFLFGYTTDLVPTWNQGNARKWGTSGTREASKSLIEVESQVPGIYDLVWTNLTTSGSTKELSSYRVRRDELTPGADTPLLTELTIPLTGTIGDFGVSNIEAALVQTVTNGSGTGIAFAQANVSGTAISEVVTPEDNKQYSAHAVVPANDGAYVILGSTNDQSLSDNTSRTDTDFYVKKVGFEGSEISTGFTLKYGSTGDEEGAAIVQADDDDGYVFLGTMTNTNGVALMVLVKINSRGELIN